MAFREEINNNVEVWKRICFSVYNIQIYSYSKYEVSNFGNVRNNRGNILKKQLEKRTGLLFVNILRDEYPKATKVYIHELVANMFLERPHDGGRVIHKDHDRLNNRTTNLEWINTRIVEEIYSNGLLHISGDSDDD